MPHTNLAKIAFWAAAAGLVYTFAGYPILMRLLTRGRSREIAPPGSGEPALPRVAAVIVACNEERRIADRIRNLQSSEYPAELLEICVVSDGSTDATVAIARAVGGERLRLIERPNRSGKAAGLNAALAEINAPIIVFSDARQRFTPETIRILAGHFADPQVGAVSGSLEIDPSQGGIGQGIDAYWKLERQLRADEALLDSCIGCTGAVYAIRRALFTPLPEDTVLDDVVIPMRIATQGFRVLHEPRAIAYDPQQLNPEAELLRKRRTLAGNFQMLFRYPAWLLPWRNRLWWQLISHKYLRLAAPALLLQALLSALAASVTPLYRLKLSGQILFYLLAVVGLLAPGLRSRFVTLPAAFVFLNWTTVRAFFDFLTRKELHKWGGKKA